MDMHPSINSPGNPWSQSGRNKEGNGGQDIEKGRFSAWNEKVWGDR